MRTSAVLQQLRDPEERAAYMYQMWAAGKLTVGPQVKGVFRRIALGNTLGADFTLATVSFAPSASNRRI